VRVELDIDDPDCVLECNKVVDIKDAEVATSMTLHDDEGHKTTNELRGNGVHESEQVLEQVLEHGLDGVASNNLAHEVGNPLDTQEAIVETPTKLVVGDQTILDT
jgi:hypothetical protein